MTDNKFLYIIPILPTIKDFKNNIENMGWKKVENKNWIPYNPYTDYTHYNKKIRYNGNNWSITFRKYLKLNSVFFVMKCSDTTYEAKDFIDSDELFNNYKNECGVLGIKSIKKYILKFYENNEIVGQKNNEYNYLFSEINEENELHRVTESCYNISINFDEKLTKNIMDNILTLISLSNIAHFMGHEFLKGEHELINKADIIKVFWGYQFLLFNCPASQKFPSFFNSNMLNISTLLDYRHMDLIEIQNNLSSSQTKAVKTQNETLKEIHKVDRGILYLTLFVIFDVTFNIIYEFIDPFEEIANLEIGILDKLIIPFILALLFSLGIYKLIGK